MRKRKKILKIALSAILVTALILPMFGCSKNNYAGKTVAVKVTAVSGQKITATVGTLGGQGNAQGGNAPGGNQQGGGQGGTPPEAPNGQNNGQNSSTSSINQQNNTQSNANTTQNNSQNNTQSSTQNTPPTPPSGGSNAQGGQGTTNQQGGQPSGAPSMGGPGGSTSGGNSASFTASSNNESLTFTLKDTTAVVSGTSFGSSSDIKVGAILNVKFDTSSNPTTVIIVSSGSSSTSVSNGTAKTTIKTDSSVSDKTYESSGNDENALRVDGAKVNLTGVTINKTGGTSSSTENGDFYGANAGFLATNGATATIKNATVTTNAANGNGIFSYGSGTTVNVSDTKIRTSKNNSGGIQTTGGATMNAANLDVETEGNSAAAIRSDRGGGTVKVTGGTFTTNGTGSPSIYSTANISVSGATLTANNSEAIVVEGENSVNLTDCNVTGSMKNTNSDENVHNVMIYQSTSGDAEEGEASFTMKNGSLTSKAGDMFYVTNTSCKIDLTNVAMTLSNENFLTVAGNTSSRGWGKSGANGGKCEFTASNQKINGNITVDKISSLNMTLSDSSNFNGTINSTGAAGTVNVTLKSGSKWQLSGNSYVSSFTGSTSDIVSNGYKLYVNGKAIN